MNTTRIGAPNSLMRTLEEHPERATQIAMRLYNALYAVQQRRLNAERGKYTAEDLEREFKLVAEALAFAQGGSDAFALENPDHPLNWQHLDDKMLNESHGRANKPPTRIYLSRGTPTGSWASDWEWSGCWSIHPSENAVEYRLVITLCGNCGIEYVNVSDAERHGIGKCGRGLEPLIELQRQSAEIEKL